MLNYYVTAFLSSMVYIGLKSAQQLNVVHKAYWWIIPTSLAMATCEVYIIATIAKSGLGWLIVAVGLGGGIGSILATYLHGRFVSK